MNQNKRFDINYPKLQMEALFKSLFSGLSVGLALNFVLGLVFWLTGIDSLALVIGVLVGVLVASAFGLGAVFYFKKFRPTVASNARRIDTLGLEERLITMVELENDDSYMANVQRQDAIAALEKVDKKQIKFRFPTKMLVTLAICAAIGLSSSTVASLSAAGLLPGGMDFIESIIQEERPVRIPVSYIAEDGGYIEGESEQLVLLGENALSVEAIPDEGYSFEGWDDGYKKPSRTDKKIDHPLVLTAIFLPLEEEGDDDGEDGEEGENGEEPGEEESDQGQESDQQSPNENENPGEGAGKYNKVNQIIDGNTYYREFLEQYKDQIMELLEKNVDELTEEEKKIIEAYINIV